jgi:hypothetical protein
MKFRHQEITPIPAPVGWNWGAFFLTWVWGIGNGVWISLLSLIPLVNLVMPFILGKQGNTLAWEVGDWESLEEFQRIQRRWAWAGFISFVVVSITIIWVCIFFLTSKITVHTLTDTNSPNLQINAIENNTFSNAVADAQRQDTDHQPYAELAAAHKAFGKAQTPAQRAQSEYYIGLAYARTGDNARSRSFELMAIKTDLTLSTPYYVMAQLDEGKGDYAASLAEASNCILYDPTLQDAYIVKADALYELGRTDEALTWLSDAAAQFPQNASLLLVSQNIQNGIPVKPFNLKF